MINVRLALENDFEYCRKTEFPEVEDHLLKQSIQNGWVYLVEINQSLVGYARLEFIWLTEPYLALITIAKGQQRKGAGTALTYQIFKDLQDQGNDIGRWRQGGAFPYRLPPHAMAVFLRC